MAWTYLLAAACLEVVMGLALKLNAGWSRPVPSVVAVAAGLGSIFLLAHALRAQALGIAYAVWTGLGTVGLTVLGMVWFGEGAPPGRLFFLALAVAGIAGLRFTESAG